MLENEAEIKQAVKIHKALGEPTRFHILQVLTKHNDLCCSQLSDHIQSVAMSTLSHHLKQLAECGLLDFRKEGTFIYYTLNAETTQKYVPYLLD